MLDEAAVWHDQEQSLYWMDLPNGRLFRLRANSRTPERVVHGPVLGGLTVQRDGSLLLLGMHGAAMIWRENRLQHILHATAETRGSRVNDAIADRAGRVLSGTMPALERKSSLLVFEEETAR